MSLYLAKEPCSHHQMALPQSQGNLCPKKGKKKREERDESIKREELYLLTGKIPGAHTPLHVFTSNSSMQTYPNTFIWFKCSNTNLFLISLN